MMTTATSGPSDPAADIVAYLRAMKGRNLALPERRH
jgi:hypothetical protein